MSDLVSVITPTFNRAYILGTAIDSIRAQGYQNWEHIIIDDGSTDDTKQLVENCNEPRISYFFQENKGQSAARNKGLDAARGKWITFLDSDNELRPNFLERTLTCFQERPDILCIIPMGYRTLELYENGVLKEKREEPSRPPENVVNPAKALFMREFIFEPNGFIHSASIRDEGIRFDESFRFMEDWDYAMTIAEKHPDSFFYLQEVLYNYHQRYGGDGLVGNQTYEGYAEVFERIYQKHKNDRLMEGQAWYPHRVEKWKKIAADHKKGLVPEPYLFHFRKSK